MIATVRQLSTHPAPAGRPQPMAFHDGILWIGCWDTAHVYGVDHATWTIRHDIELPGKPYGIASFEGAIRIVIAVDDDDRYVYRYVPGQALSEAGRVACPELSGSHLTSDGRSLYLVQQGLGRMLELGADGTTKREFPLPTRCAGAAFCKGTFTMITADDEFDVLALATLDLEDPKAEPQPIAPMNVLARGLALDGSTWWTALREENEIVSFAL